MVELLEQRIERLRQIGEVLHPAADCTHFAAYAHLDLEGVAVKAGTLVPFGDVRQSVRRLDRKNFEYFHALYTYNDWR